METFFIPSTDEEFLAFNEHAKRHVTLGSDVVPSVFPIDDHEPAETARFVHSIMRTFDDGFAPMCVYMNDNRAYAMVVITSGRPAKGAHAKAWYGQTWMSLFPFTSVKEINRYVMVSDAVMHIIKDEQTGEYDPADDYETLMTYDLRFEGGLAITTQRYSMEGGLPVYEDPEVMPSLSGVLHTQFVDALARKTQVLKEDEDGGLPLDYVLHLMAGNEYQTLLFS